MTLRRPRTRDRLSGLTCPVLGLAYAGRRLRRRELQLGRGDSQRGSQFVDRVESWIGVATGLEIRDRGLIQSSQFRELDLRQLPTAPSLSNREFTHIGMNHTHMGEHGQVFIHVRVNLFSPCR